MSENVKADAVMVKSSAREGVFMRYFFGKEDNDRLNNFEITIVPGFEIAPHTHEDTTEFFYVVSGRGEFLDGADWVPVQKGAAFKAPTGLTHGVRNNSGEMLVLFAAFSPAAR